MTVILVIPNLLHNLIILTSKYVHCQLCPACCYLFLEVHHIHFK